VLRDAEGKVLDEDDDGLLRRHARLSLDSLVNGDPIFWTAAISAEAWVSSSSGFRRGEQRI
jgi:hypothetical protein